MTTKQIRQEVLSPTHLIVSDGVDVASNVGYSSISTVLADVESDIAFLTANRSRYIGMTDKPTITDDGINTITIGAGQAYLCDCEAFDETSYGKLMDIAGASFALATDTQVYYVVAQRTGETAAYALITSRDDVAKPNKALVAIAIRTGTVFHIFEGNTLGVGLPEKIERLLEQRDGFRKVTGIGLSADNSRVVTVASGIVSYGAHTKDLTAAVSNVDSIRFYTWNGTAYTFSLTTLANHTQFNGASGLQTMSNANRFNVNWFWRGAESQKHVYSILSRSEFSSLAEALASKPAAPPDIVTAHAVFVGGIVYQRDNATPAGYITPEQAQGTVTVQLHNDLGGLQGGATGDYQHLTASQVSTFAAKQDALISGTNIKTINGDSILGAGNLTVSGGTTALPEISTGEATSVEQTAFTVPVTVSAFGLTDETALRIAVDYRVTGAPTWTRTTATAVSTLTTVNIALTGLTAETEYEYRGVATDTLNPSIEVLANIRVVETEAAPVVSIDTPTLTVTGSPDAVPETPTLTTSAFSVSNGSDTHQDTDWQILDGTSAVVWESLANSTNKTTIVVPSGALDVSTTYTFRARHRGVAHGVSAWGEVVATTLAQFDILPLMAVAHGTTPFVTIYDQQVDSFVKLSNPSSLPSSDGWGVAFSNDDVYMAVSTEASPFVTIYKRSGDDFTKLANPTGGLPPGTVRGVDFTHGGYPQ